MDEPRLTAKELRQLEKMLHRPHDARVHKRTLAVLEWGRGKGVVEVAESLGVTRQSVHNWISRYRHSGKSAALTDAPRPGRPRQADSTVEALLTALMNVPPECCGYHAAHWTAPLLGEQVHKNVGKQFGAMAIRRCLFRLGYVWKQPRYVLVSGSQREKKTLRPAHPRQHAQAQRGAGGE